MGKGGPKREVAEYRMSIHFGVCYRTDALLGIYVNEKTAWEGRMEGMGVIPINAPELFGGNQKEGGLVGDVYVMPGDVDQVAPEMVARKYGLTPETCQGFRGYLSLLFTGSGRLSNSNSGTGFFSEVIDIIADPSKREGFLWSMNSPIVAQSIAFRPEVAPVGLDPDKALIHIGPYPDANPVHIIYECYTNDEWGMGELPEMMGSSWAAAGDQIYDEGFGVSIKWVEQTEIQDFVNEMIRHIQATVYLDPETGKHEIKLLRGDYNAEDLFELTPDNCKLQNHRVRQPGEIVNEVVVKFTNPVNEKDLTIAWQATASVLAHGLNSTSHEYPGIRREDLALQVAQRDVREASAPLISVDAVVNREAWNKKPGDVVRVTYPEYDMVDVIMRVGKINYGRPGETTIKVPLLQDIFSLDNDVSAGGPITDWVDPSEPPTPIAHEQVLTTPTYFVQTGALQNVPVDLVYPEVTALSLAYQPGYDTRSYDLIYATTDVEGAPTLASAGTKPIIERAVLDVALPVETNSTLPNGIVIIPDRGPRTGGFLFIGGDDEDSEIALITGAEDDNWLLSRGVLDTIPRAWPIGTPVWFVNAGSRCVDTTVRAAGEIVEYQHLTNTSLGQLPLSDAPVYDSVLSERPHLPLRPANVKVNNVAFGSVAAGTTINFTWATRNRLLEAGQAVAWTAAAVPPEYRQKTLITLYDAATDAEIIQYAFWNDTSFSIPASYLARWSQVRAVFTSERDDLGSLHGHSILITGLANNPGAPLPPDPPALGEPPSPILAPGEDSFDVTAGAIGTEDGGQLPAIVVSGMQDNPDALGLVVRYRRVGTTGWTYRPAVTLNRQPLTSVITGVAPNTTYEVQVAYIQNNILGEFLDLGTITTGQLVATQAGGALAEQLEGLFEDIEAASERAQSALDRLKQAMGEYRLTAEGLIERALDNFNMQSFLDARMYLDGVDIGTVIVRNDTQRVEGDEALTQVLSLIGAKSGDGLAFIMDLDTTKVSPTETWAQRLALLTAEDGDNYAAILEERDARIDEDGVLASDILALEGDLTTSFGILHGEIVDETTLRINEDGLLAADILTLDGRVTTEVATLEGYIDQEIGLLIDEDEVLATAITTLDGRVTTEVGTLNGRITNEVNVLVDEDEALLGMIESLEGDVTTNYSTLNGRITTEVGLLVDEDEVLAGAIQDLEGTVNTNYNTLDGRITTEVGLLVDEDEVLLTAITSLQGTVDDHTASIDEYADLFIDIDGKLSLTWGLTHNVDGRISGQKLQTVGGPGTVYTTVDWLVDAFRVFDPDSNSDVPMFSVIDGVARVAGDKVVTASILDNAVTNLTTAYTASSFGLASGSETQVQSLSIETKGGRVAITGNVRMAASGTTAPSGTVKIYRRPVGGSTWTLLYTAPGPGAVMTSINLDIQNTFNFAPTISQQYVEDVTLNTSSIPTTSIASGQVTGFLNINGNTGNTSAAGDNHSHSISLSPSASGLGVTGTVSPSGSYGTSITKNRSAPVITISNPLTQVVRGIITTYGFDAMVPIGLIDYPAAGNWEYQMTCQITGTTPSAANRFLTAEETKK